MLLETRADMELARNVAEIARRMSGEQDYKIANSNMELYGSITKCQRSGFHIDQVVRLDPEENRYLVLYTK